MHWIHQTSIPIKFLSVFYHLLLKNIMVSYVKTKSFLGMDRHNVSSSKEEFVYRKRLQKRDMEIDMQKNRGVIKVELYYTKKGYIRHKK